MAVDICTGRTSSLTLDGAVSYTSSWNLKKSSGIIDISHLGSYNKTNVASINDWSATVEAIFNADDAYLTALFTAQEAQTELTNVGLYVSGTMGWECTSALISSISVVATSGDAVKVSVELVPGSDDTDDACAMTWSAGA